MKAPPRAVSEDQGLAELLRQAFAQAPFPITSAYLFGSHAERRAHRESDLDLAVLLPYAVSIRRRSGSISGSG